MALPFILSLLGSGLAGAGTLAMSPLIAGAIGSGLGTAIQEKDLGAGIRSGLTAGLLGGIGGALLVVVERLQLKLGAQQTPLASLEAELPSSRMF
jgi:hypothetical protein